MEGLLDGFVAAVTPVNLLWALVGVTLGTAVGVLPGIGPALTVALLLPLTSRLPATSAFIMFAGIYYGAMYGGSTTSILLNTPGETGAIVTALEGNKMARAGRGAAALATAAIGSFIAGTIATVLLGVLAPAIVDLAVLLGPEDYFALVVLALTTISTVLGRSVVRGLVSLALGLAIAMVGIDFSTGQARLSFGVPQLLDGIDVVVIVIALFAVAEALYVASRLRQGGLRVLDVGRNGRWLTRDDWRRSWPAWLRGTGIGFPLGVLPAGGSEIPTFLSYATERRVTRHPEEFGKGAIEGVAGPEAANNAVAAGSLVPLLTLGLPTGATAAVILVAFQQYGLQPGPLLFDNHPELVWTLIASLLIGNAMLLVINLPLVGVWVKLLKVPTPYLYAGIIMFAMLGGYAADAGAFTLVLLLVIGVLGFFMRRHGIPIAPAVIGAILGGMAETQFRRALAISQGDYGVFVTSPVAAVLLALALLVVGGPFLLRRLRRADRPRPRDPEPQGTASQGTTNEPDRETST